MSRFAHFPRRPVGKLFAALALVALGAPSSAVNAGDEDYAAMLHYIGRGVGVHARQRDAGENVADHVAASVLEGPFEGRTLASAKGQTSTASLGGRDDDALALLDPDMLPGQRTHSDASDTSGRILSLSVSELPR